MLMTQLPKDFQPCSGCQCTARAESREAEEGANKGDRHRLGLNNHLCLVHRSSQGYLPMRRFLSCGLLLSFMFHVGAPARAKDLPEAPVVHDPRLVVELFAAAPDIVHPIGADFDSKG